jgi:hypothetical protein
MAITSNAQLRNSLFSLPINPREFVFVREIVVGATSKCFLKSMAQALGQMFCRGGYSKFVAVTTLPFHDARQGVVFRGSPGFIEQKMLYLFVVVGEKRAIQIDEATRFACARLFASWANRRLCRTPMTVFFI